MWDSEDGSVETLNEPPIGNAACPQTSSDTDAVILGGVPLNDGTPAPGERAGTRTHPEFPTHDFNAAREDRAPFLRLNEPLSSAPTTQNMSAERDALYMDPIYAFYATEGSVLNWMYSCLCCPLCAHGDTAVAHGLLRDAPASFDTPAGQFFQRKDDITCLPGCWKPTLAISSCTVATLILSLASPLSATSSVFCFNIQHAFSLIGTAVITYLGGARRKEIMQAHDLREPSCHLGCCTLEPPFNPYCCWFCCTGLAAAQEHKAMLRLLRRRASDPVYDRL